MPVRLSIEGRDPHRVGLKKVPSVFQGMAGLKREIPNNWVHPRTDSAKMKKIFFSACLLGLLDKSYFVYYLKYCPILQVLLIGPSLEESLIQPLSLEQHVCRELRGGAGWEV